MTTLIRLQPKQTKSVKVECPFKAKPPLPLEDKIKAIEAMLKGNKEARDQLILSHIGLIANLVGRFLYYWPDARKFEDDLFSEGLVSLIEVIDSLKDANKPKLLPMKIINLAKVRIEMYLQTFSQQVSVPLGTQLWRQGIGMESIKQVKEVPVREYHRVGSDIGPAIVDMKDILETLEECDTEDFITKVLGILDKVHGIKFEELTEEQFEMVEDLINLSKGIV